MPTRMASAVVNGSDNLMLGSTLRFHLERQQLPRIFLVRYGIGAQNPLANVTWNVALTMWAARQGQDFGFSSSDRSGQAAGFTGDGDLFRGITLEAFLRDNPKVFAWAAIKHQFRHDGTNGTGISDLWVCYDIHLPGLVVPPRVTLLTHQQGPTDVGVRAEVYYDAVDVDLPTFQRYSHLMDTLRPDQ